MHVPSLRCTFHSFYNLRALEFGLMKKGMQFETSVLKQITIAFAGLYKQSIS